MCRARLTLVLALTTLLAACGPGENEPGPGGVTVGEAEALDEAAAMLEERKLPAEAINGSPDPAGEAGADAGASAPTEE